MLPVLLAFLSLFGSQHIATNFSVDLYGVPDTRTSTWGVAGATTWQIQFAPPAGQRVRILRFDGDLIAFPKVLPGDSPVPRGSTAGVLLGFQTTAPDGSVLCAPCADNTGLYIQGALSDAPIRLPYAWPTDMLLEPDNVLIVKVADFLNTTGKPIHIEPTVTVTFRFEGISK